MGIFDKWKKEHHSKESNSVNDKSYKKPGTPSYETAIQLLNSSNYESKNHGRKLMLEISEYTSDPRVYMWMAKEFERGGVYSAAASWYKKAYQAGVAEAKDGFVRCNNPYHINSYFSITGERGCGTPHIRYEIEAENKQRNDYSAAIEKLNHEPTHDEAMKCLKTICCMS